MRVVVVFVMVALAMAMFGKCMLYYFKYVPAIVLMSQTNGSKLSREGAAELAKLQAAYKDKGVLFYMINSNLSDSRDEAAAEVKAQGVKVDASKLRIAENATLILPLHRELDQLRESAAGERFEAPVLGLYEVRDGKFARAQMFHFDTAAILDFLARAGQPPELAA